MDKLTQADASSQDIVAENLHKLSDLFPEAFKEGKIDFQVLKETLGEYCETREERYNFTWPGKSKARRLAQTPSTGTLRPCPEESVDWDSTENLFIEGDNLEVLKLLQKSYQGQVKMIYIDPPYNTGGDFVYPDNYADNLKGYLEYTNQVDQDGNKQSSNTESSGRKHSNWLNMMYPRLHLAKNLLSDNGVIFVTIDDNEQSLLKSICDEIFGEENFVTCIAWQKVFAKKNKALVSGSHDHILLYTKDISLWTRNLLPRSEEQLAAFKNKGNDPRGSWQSVSFSVQSEDAKKRASYRYEITLPSGRVIGAPTGRHWNGLPDKFEKLKLDNRIWFGPNGDNPPREKVFLSEVQSGIVPDTWWKHEDTGNNQEAKKEILELFADQEPFSTPKPTRLVKRMLQIATNAKGSDIVLDFFAGSCTTADAVMRLNTDDEGDRRFIMVQLPEPTDYENYSTIADIGRERTRLAGSLNKITNPSSKGDLGFKVFKLDSSNIEAWDSNVEDLEENVLKSANVLKSDRDELDIVYELFLKYGLNLSYPVHTHEIAGKQVYEIGAGSLFICLEDGINGDFVEALIKLHESFDPEEEQNNSTRVVFKDSGFASDAAKKDAESTLKDAGILDVKCL